MNELSRRDFMLSTVGVAASAVLSPSSNAFAKPPKTEFGVQLYTVQSELAKDPEGTLRKIADIGYRTVEFRGDQSKALAPIIERVGLSCRSLHYGMPQLQSQLDQVIEDAQRVRARFVVCAAAWVADMSRLASLAKEGDMTKAYMALAKTFSLDDWHWNIEQLNAIGAKVKKAGLQLAYHNHGFEFKKFDGKSAFDEMLAMTDPASVAFELDCGWAANAGQDPADYLRHYPQRIHLLHIKDIARVKPDNTDFDIASTAIGRGVIDWRRVLDAATAAGVAGYFVEHEPPFSMPPLEQLKVSYDYLSILESTMR